MLLLTGLVFFLVPQRPTVAQVSSEKFGSILVFPKVIVDGTYDTLIQVSNGGNGIISARCFYASGVAEGAVTEFPLSLTKQQPTHWVASRGRLEDPLEPITACRTGAANCDGVGFDPGTVPALASTFKGELVCVEVDAAGTPFAGNHLAGSATLRHLQSGDVAEYSALSLAASTDGDGDNTLCLGGASTAECPSGGEYAGCPHTWLLNQTADGAADAVVGGPSSVLTEFTMVPCTRDLQSMAATTVTVGILVANEMEQLFSASASVPNWGTFTLTSAGGLTQGVLGSAYIQTRIEPVAGSAGALLIAHEIHQSGGMPSLQSSVAANLHHTAEVLAQPDRLILPPLVTP